MKRIVLLAVGFVLLFGACEMPGAGEVASQVQGQVSDISDEIQEVVQNNEELSNRIDDLQEQIASGSFEMPDMPDFDFQEVLDGIDEDLNAVSVRSDSLLEEMTLLVDSQTVLIDSLQTRIDGFEDEINGLEGEIASLRSTVNSIGSRNDSGRDGSSSGGTGRTGTSGGTTGGSTGGSTGRS